MDKKLNKEQKEEYLADLLGPGPYLGEPPIFSGAAQHRLWETADLVTGYLMGYSYTVEGARSRIKDKLKGTDLIKDVLEGGDKGLRNSTKIKNFIFPSNQYLRFRSGVWEYFAEEISNAAVVANREFGDPRNIQSGEVEKGIKEDEEIYPLVEAARELAERPEGPVEEAQEMCKELHLFYDATLLKKAARSLQYLFLEGASKSSSGLADLIKNYFVNRSQASKGIIRPPKPEHINGPLSLSYHTSDKFEKRIYIFGEMHGYKNNCEDQKKSGAIVIVDYLSLLFSTADVFIDFYFEIPTLMTPQILKERSMDWTQGYITDLMLKLSECFHYQHWEKCPWKKKVRMHAVDSRIFNIKDNPILQRSSTRRLWPVERGQGMSFVEARDVGLIRNFSLRLTDPPKFTDFMMNELWQSPLIRKETTRPETSYLEKSTYKKILEKVFEEQDWDKFKNSARKLSKAQPGDSLDQADLRFLVNSLTYAAAFYMDIYQLARVFKIFKESPDKPSGQYNILVYEGDAHARFLRIALEEFGFQEHYHLREGFGSRCLGMRGKQIIF